MEPLERLAVLHTNLTEFASTLADPKLKLPLPAPVKKPMAKVIVGGAMARERAAIRARARGYSLQEVAHRVSELCRK